MNMSEEQKMEQQNISMLDAQKAWADRVVEGWIKFVEDFNRQGFKLEESKKE